MDIAEELQKLRHDMKHIKMEIEKLKSHNFTLLTIIGSIIEDEAVSPSL